ncbi:hypothetical protein [Spirosoma sp. 209]|uniref:hypothetical protein n=1 Tax=Spirosoma sp. 209 TaxID=1955701 RepID=UPI001115BCF5|nr:hypothetical protein [Spirosoma sp. 209]
MPSLFKLFSQSCGLSLRESHLFLGTNVDTTKSWWSGRRNPPEALLEKLVDLSIRQDIAAQDLVLQLQTLAQKAKRQHITLTAPALDSQAQALGWPSVNAYGAVIRKAVEKIPIELALRLVVETDYNKTS